MLLGLPATRDGTGEYVGTATAFLHYTDRIPTPGATGNAFSQVNGWDDSMSGQISIDGTSVATGLIGELQAVNVQRVDVEH